MVKSAYAEVDLAKNSLWGYRYTSQALSLRLGHKVGLGSDGQQPFAT